MARRVFYSFHYEEERDRVSQVRNKANLSSWIEEAMRIRGAAR
jgi:hypothetical protein